MNIPVQNTINCNDSQFKVEFKLYHELRNPSWIVKKSLINKLNKIWNRLKTYEGGIPAIPGKAYKGCLVRSENTELWYCFEECVIWQNGNMIEIKRDNDSEFENEVLRSTPSDIYKDISCYF